MKITPVILAGGIGSRLWPLSRKSFPKQFATLISGQSLFQTTLERLSGDGFDDPMVLTGSDFRFVVTEQMAQSGKQPRAILIEPEGRNTAPAILAAAQWLAEHQPDTLMLVAPSDHAIPDAAGFRAVVQGAAGAAQDGRLVTFGITPTHPETGYGYIALSDPDQTSGVQPVSRFVEKPDQATAEKMLATGGYLWNGGIFLFSPAALIAAFEAHAPALLAPVAAALEHGKHDLDFLRLDPESWAGAEDISIDHAIMERADTISVQPYVGAWSDLGDWRAVCDQLPQDGDGNAMTGQVSTLECHNTLFYAEEGGPELVGVGLDNLLVVAMRDAVLVADRDQAQKVKDVVTMQRAKSTPAAESFPWDHRPWGRFETLALGTRFQVKRIVVKPGGILSLQSHHHRAEHWVVVEGTALVTIGDTQQLVSENQSVYVPLGETHRMENPGKVPMVLIEVQTGTYLGEDDIIRYEDVYARDQGAKG
ncbi:MAG: mannose-1-phosphate guanylyltransferase/mannose-6-phosphate isomerase [Roseovarius sp.]